MRWLLLACGPMNLLGALMFSPPMEHFRLQYSLPSADPFYLWILSSWILAFGVAFFYQGYTGKPNRSVLTLAVWGKLTFVAQVTLLAARDHWALPLWLQLGLPDLACALVFAWWLWGPRGDWATPSVPR